MNRRTFLLALPSLVACRPRARPNVTHVDAPDARAPSPDVVLTAPPAMPVATPGDLPDAPALVLDDLFAQDLRLAEVRAINDAVAKLTFTRGPRTLHAKWKPLGTEASEVQDGYAGNNAPRCESAAFRLNRTLFGRDDARRHLVAPVAVRAFHRDVVCHRACAGVARLPGYTGGATFARVNDHLVLGALTYWLDDVVPPARFHGGLWDPARFEHESEYRRSFSDLCLFLTLIAHGDANYPANFLLRLPSLDRCYSIDNGRAFDGVPYYTGRGDPDWEPFAHLSPAHPVAPAFSRETLRALAAIDRDALVRDLRVTAAVDLVTGRSLQDPDDEPSIRQLAASPLHAGPDLERRGSHSFIARDGARAWFVTGIGEPGIDATLDRAHAFVASYGPGSFD